VSPRVRTGVAAGLCGIRPFSDDYSDSFYTYFDWSDSALSHPIFSPALFLTDAARAFPDDPGSAARLRDAYLAPWVAYAGREELARLFALAQRAAPLHHTVAYHRDILPTLAARWAMARIVPFSLRLLLPPGPADRPRSWWRKGRECEAFVGSGNGTIFVREMRLRRTRRCIRGARAQGVVRGSGPPGADAVPHGDTIHVQQCGAQRCAIIARL